MKLESERITNISELEKLIQSARTDMVYLKRAVESRNIESITHFMDRIDLKLHSMEAFNFMLERRIVNVCERQ